MRIDRISVVNFGSQAAYTWEPGDARLTVVTGPNGVGKTTRFVDAPLFALFGEVPDGSSPDQLVRIGASDMSVSLEFVLDGIRYRFVRRRTTRAGGKTSADAQQQLVDGSWKPLASGAREVTAEAIRLLRMDPHTFRTVVVIAQGDAMRFVKATPGKGTPQAPGRAAVLSTLVVDPAFALVETLARAEVTALEAASVADRAQMARLADAIAELEPVRDVVVARTAEIHELALQQTAEAAELDRIQGRLTVLAAEIAKGDAAAAEATRLEAERTSLGERYRREKATVVSAEATIIQAEAIVAGAADIEAAELALPEARLRLSHLIEAEGAHRARVDEIAERRRRFDPLEAALRETRATWTADLRAAQARVTDLQASLAALEPVICRKCGTANVVDQAGLAEQLIAARARVTELEAGEPTETMAHSRERVAIKRLEERQTEDGWDPAPLTAERESLSMLERTAARAGEVEAARRAVETATAAKASAEAELASIDTAGQALRERLDKAKAATGEIAVLGAERDAMAYDLATARNRIDALQRQRNEAERGLAQAEASVARLEQLTAERDSLAANLVYADVDLARLRRVVVDAGVKGIPARVVEGVLPELIDHANEFLGQLFPGMTLDLRATRAKADGSGTIEALDIWIRKATGELQRWSGGEGTAIALSIAVGLSRLGARRSGARVATQIIDEPDGLDVDVRRAFGQAMQGLAHRGDLERVVVITHQDGIPDFADDVVELEPADEPNALVAA